MDKILIAAAVLFAAYVLYELYEHKCIDFVNRDADLGLGMKAIVFSDLHCSRVSRKTFKRIEQENPDCILIPGDFVNANTTDKERDRANSYLRILAGIAPVYYSFGNHELKFRDNDPYNFNHFIQHLPDRLYVLDDSFEKLCRGTFIYGMSLNHDFYKKGKAYDHTKADKKIFRNIPEGKKILLAHNPDYYDHYVDVLNPDLIISGHLHGGMIRLPFIKGIVFTSFGCRHYSDGYYFGKKLYVERGLGNHFIPARFRNRVEITIMNL